MHKSKIKQISLAVCLALMPFSSYAAGLGKLNVSSGIGEPLRAEIELLSVTPEELSTLTATIASEDAYAQQGIPHLGIHNNIKVDVAKGANGAPILKIHSNQPVSDPYLDMLIQVDWATGRLQRDYTVLLDPPGYKPEADSTVPVTLPSTAGSNKAESQQQATNSNAVDNASVPSKKSKKQKRVAQPVAQQESVVAPVPATAGAEETTTKRGDTLISIAKEMQVEGVSLDQMLVGLFENNKDAFTSGNMNRLKVGQIIKVPSKEALTSVSEQQAKKVIKIHSQNWNTYRNALAGNVESTPPKEDAAQKQSSSGKIATAEDKAAPATTGPKDVVKLSAGDKAGTKGAKDAASSAEAKLQALQEETTARENALKEASDRTAALEKQIADMQKLLAMKSQTMTEMQKNAEADGKKADEAPKEDTKAEAKPAAEVAPAEVNPTEANPVEVKPVEAPKPAPKPEAKKAVVPVVVPAAEEPSFIDGLMSSIDLPILGGVGGVALLGAGWMFLRNKRRKDLDSFERGILTSGGLRANTVFGNTTGNASMSDTSFLTDFAQSADGNMIDTNDVDPIAEAEVYMAYGRDAQAEEILKDAIVKEPKRYELHLKLLELYAARKDTSAFETIAGELYTTLGAGDPTWAKVAAMGSAMEPTNPLYNLDGTATGDLTTQAQPSITALPEVAVDAVADNDAGLDFNFEEEPITKLAESEETSELLSSAAKEPSSDLDNTFDFGSLDSNSVESAESETAGLGSVDSEITSANSSNEASNLMDFDLGEFAKEVPVETKESAIDSSAPELGGESFDFSAAGADHLKEVEEAAASDFDIDFSLPTEVNANDSTQASPEALSAPNVIEDVSFDLDLPTESEEKSNESMVMDASEISFDLPSIDEPVALESKPLPKSDDTEANTFDLSNIDLNLADAESELSIPEPELKVAKEATSVAESPDVNVKLDLVAAYIDMDDKEGARELLEEILKEGGPNQQAKAQELLDSLA